MKILLYFANHKLIPYKLWRSYLRWRYKDSFIGTYRNVPILKPDYLIEDSDVTNEIKSGKIR